MTPIIWTTGAVGGFLLLERIFPGRVLPNSPNWYLRVLGINLVQIFISLSTNNIWSEIFPNHSLFHTSKIESPAVEGLIGWFVGTFFFYWWHRIRHAQGLWRIFHQLHHSPQRIEGLTSFYKHPLEILSDAILAAVVLVMLLGASTEAIMWFNLYATVGEYFYHSNVKTPDWVRYFIQTPELHSVHHELDVHKFNFSDFPLWDKLFGTYKDATGFAPKCGFPRNNERKIFEMLVFKDVYND
jgi:sterol desaturase/sphingolipid hydroxylase (fatty acid hydroxylase superfamily)